MNVIRYNSRWDGSTWFTLALCVIACVVPCFLEPDALTVSICLLMLAFVILTFLSVYYKIDGDRLVVYVYFVPKSYPIDKIKEIKPTKSLLSAPATSLSHRIAISFTDQSVLKSVMPLIVSPVRTDDFVARLLAVNPAICVDSLS